MVRELAEKLATLEEFSEDVIAEIKFFRGNFEDEVKILKAARAMATVQATSAQGKVLVKLMKPREKICVAVGQCEFEAGKFAFTANEVLNFVEEVGDKNEIHRLTPPIVPGFLVLETLLKSEKFSSCENLTLRFKQFTAAGEQLVLQSKGDKIFELRSRDAVKVLISVD